MFKITSDGSTGLYKAHLACTLSGAILDQSCSCRKSETEWQLRWHESGVEEAALTGAL